MFDNSPKLFCSGGGETRSPNKGSKNKPPKSSQPKK